jgi:hypothetical protein
MPTIGLPYAEAGVDEDGRYFVICPATGCGQKFYDQGELDSAEAGAEDRATKGAARAYANHYDAEHTGEIDHTKCPREAHTFDAGDEHYEGRVDEHGNQLCNDDAQPIFYCTRDENYHHVGAGAEPCFLIQEPGWDIPAPARGEHAYDLENGGQRVCILHRGSDDPCPVLDLAAIVNATPGGVTA